MNNNLNKILRIWVLLLTVILVGCTELPNSNYINQPPETFLSIFPDSVISPQKTKIKISWWADDPDGLVTGYRFSFDSLNWTLTTKNDSTFQLNISGQDSTFRFWVAAIDDKGSIDPTPASNLYPVINSPPSVTFNAGTEIPDTTFTVATFAWTGTDPDGDNTIRYYYWALNDTNNWHTVASTVNLITLRQDSGIVPNSNNKLFLKVQDQAGAFSRVVTMPDTGQVWFVRPKTGRILLIDDYSPTINDNPQAIAFYVTAFDTIQHSILDIKISDGANLPTIPNPMFIETMKLFEAVVWYAGRGNGTNDNANFSLAQQTLPFYIASGGKVLFTTGMPNTIDAQGNILDFAPTDSVTNYAVPLISAGVETIVYNTSYPVLQTGPSSPERVRGIYPKAGANIIYKLPFNPPYDTNKITVCIKDAVNNPKIVLMIVPLHRMDYASNAAVFFRRVINVDFGIN